MGNVNMPRTILIAAILAALSSVALAQTPVAPGATMASTIRLTVDDAVKMALDRNVDLAAVRIDPQISDARVAEAAGAVSGGISIGPEIPVDPRPTRDFTI